MKITVRIAVLIAVVGIVLAEAPRQQPGIELTASGAQTTLAEKVMAERLFERLNDERAARGIGRLRWSVAAADAAREWSRHMGRNRTLSHSGAVWRTAQISPYETIAASGENVAYASGRRARFGRIHVMWMTSDLHRRNMLLKIYDAAGIGVQCIDGTLWATMILVSRDVPTSINSTIPPETPIDRPGTHTMGCGPRTWPRTLDAVHAHSV